jgi:hypothetical protein
MGLGTVRGEGRARFGAGMLAGFEPAQQEAGAIPPTRTGLPNFTKTAKNGPATGFTCCGQGSRFCTKAPGNLVFENRLAAEIPSGMVSFRSKGTI